MTLDQIPIHKKVKIIAITGTKKTRIRLLEMGLVPGTEIYIRKIAPWKNLIEIYVRHYALLFRTEIARPILVEEL